MRDYLKFLRKKKKITKVEAAKDVGVSATYYSYIESGERQKDMAYSMMQKLAKAFNVSTKTIVNAEMRYQQNRETINRQFRE